MHRVGLIGLGKMGLPIARNLMERGFEVTGYRRSGSPELAAAGGTVAGSAAEVAAAADVLLSIVPDAAAVEEIIAGPAGTLTALRPGTVHIEMSTIDIGHKTPAARRGPGPRRRPAGLPDQRQPRDGRAAPRHHVRVRRPGQRGPGRPGAGRGVRALGLHRRVRHRRADEVHREPAPRRAHGRGRRSARAGPPQRPRPRSRAGHPGRLDRRVGHLEAARPADARPGLDARARPGRHPASHPRADRGLRRRGRACPPRCSARPRMSSTRRSPTAGATSTSRVSTIRSPAHPP